MSGGTSQQGPPAVGRPATSRERAFHGEGVEVAVAETPEDLGEIVRECEAAGRAVVPAGLGTHAGLADPVEKPLLVSVQALRSVVTYEPDDFTIGVEAGLPLAELRELLARNGQELAVDLGITPRGSAGGLVARAPASPRQGAYGNLSSLLLGVEGVRGGGRPFRGGGMVVKNVAGYQIGKLLVGSAGTAGFLTRVNFKLRPLPETRRLRFAAFEDAGAAWTFAMTLRRCGVEPTSLHVLSRAAESGAGLPDAPNVTIVGWHFEGRKSRVEWQAGESDVHVGEADASQWLEGEPVDRWLHTLVEGADPDGAPPDLAVARISVLPTQLPDLAAFLAGALGAGADLRSDVTTGLMTCRETGPVEALASFLTRVAEAATQLRGNARLLYAPPALRARWPRQLTEDPNAALAETVRRVFDPQGGFAAGARPAPVEAT